jgi:hypothetical protein
MVVDGGVCHARLLFVDVRARDLNRRTHARTISLAAHAAEGNRAARVQLPHQAAARRTIQPPPSTRVPSGA